MLDDDGYSDSLLEEFDEIAWYLANFAGNASIMLENGDEDGFTDLIERSSIDLYDYRRGKPLKFDEKWLEAEPECSEKPIPRRKMNGWTIY